MYGSLEVNAFAGTPNDAPSRAPRIATMLNQRDTDFT
jgi:hypothetical protein